LSAKNEREQPAFFYSDFPNCRFTMLIEMQDY